MLNLLLVALGGSIGASTRYLISTWAAERFGTNFPFGTLMVNIAGCFIIGAFMTIATEKFIVHPHWRLLVTVGFLGGLTTFSSFSYETFKLLGDGNWLLAVGNIMTNLVFSLLATWLGISLAKAL